MKLTELIEARIPAQKKGNRLGHPLIIDLMEMMERQNDPGVWQQVPGGLVQAFGGTA
ncbi:MAG: hypothetical protein ACLRXC_06625 [[Clostridium] leptum]